MRELYLIVLSHNEGPGSLGTSEKEKEQKNYFLIL